MNFPSTIVRNFLLNSFFLLAVIAGLQSTGLFDEDVVTYYNGNGVTYHTELVLDTTSKTLSSVALFDKDLCDHLTLYTLIENTYFRSDAYFRDRILFKCVVYKQWTHRKTSLSYIFFNITHQNTGEGEASSDIAIVA
jgi:hypothetical protein